MAPQEMESLFLEQWRHYMRHSWHAKFEKGESDYDYQFIYLPIHTTFWIFISSFLEWSQILRTDVSDKGDSSFLQSPDSTEKYINFIIWRKLWI